MSGNGNQVPLASSQRGPGPYPRASTPHRPVECYHPSSVAGTGYMPNTTGGSQPTAQPSLRVQPTPPQPSAPPAPQQDMSKTNMSGHNFVSQNQTQPRPQYANFQYRATQHGTRPNSHPRQQQPFIPGAASTTGPVMYPTLVFQPTPMSMQTYQQPRSGSQGYYHYMGHYIGYNNPPSHTPPYYGYATNSPQLPTPNLQTNSAGSRTNPSTLVGPQASSAASTAPTATLPHVQPPSHLHQPVPGVRQPVQKRSHRLPIIDPVTRLDILSSDIYTNDNSFLNTESNDRQTPQPEPAPTHSVAEEFVRMVNEAVNQPSPESTIKSNFVPKNVEMPESSTSSIQPQTNTISSMSSINNNVIKSELVNLIDNRNPGPDVAVEPSETPVVSAISDSPVIVPKVTTNVKPTQPSETIVQSSILDTCKVTLEKVVPSKPVKVGSPPVETASAVAVPTPTATVTPTSTLIPTSTLTPTSTLIPTSTLTQTSTLTPMSTLTPTSTLTQTSTLTLTSTLNPTSTLTPTSTQAPTPTTMAMPAPTRTPVVTTAAIPIHVPATPVLTSQPITTAAPQPQRVHRERVHKSEEKDKPKDHSHEKDFILPPPAKQNGPVPTAISSVDSFQQSINLPTSQFNQHTGADITKKQLNIKHSVQTAEPTLTVVATVTKVESLKKPIVQEYHLTPTELLSASIEKVSREQPTNPDKIPERKSSAFEAQAKLTQSISSVCRTHQSESKMKDININNQTSDPDTANGNTAEVTKTETAVKEDINKNEKSIKNNKNNSKKAAKMAAVAASNEVTVQVTEPCENGKNETDKVVNVEQEDVTKSEEIEEIPTTETEEKSVETPSTPQTPVFVPKYKYTDEQWSPLNKSGKKCYDIGLLKQIKEDPLSKNKPNAPLLEVCNVIRTAPMQEPLSFTPILRPMNDSLFPPFAKGGGLGGSRNAVPRDSKKNVPAGGKGSVKLTPSGGSNNPHKPIIHVSLSLRDDVKLKESESAWKPTRFQRTALSDEEQKTQEVYKQFRGILNKLTPQKFDTLLDKVKNLEINNQKRLEGVIDLIFEKAIEEPNFSEAYAAMCNKLSTLKVPAENATNPEQRVNFRALIISKCQNQFETTRTDEQIMKLEKDHNECTDPVKKKELHLMLQEEHRRVRMRSVGNVRFIGELYKLKMLTCKIMDYCMNYLIDKLEEEKLECLCKLLTTIGEQIENEENSQLDIIFKKMQNIVDRKCNKISSRVKFMIQDVIALRKRKWVAKSVVDSQPKMMDQIQKEAEQQQRHIELMNSGPMGGGGGGGGGFRRDDRNKRGGDSRRQNTFMDNTWKTTTRTTTFPVDTSKLKAVTQKNLNNIKLAPHQSAWNHGSGTKPQAQASSNSLISLSKNKYSVLENVQTDPSSIRANREMTPSYHSKGASIERSTFNSNRGDFMSGGNSRSGSVGVARSSSGTSSQSEAPSTPPPATETSAASTTTATALSSAPTPAPSVPQEPLTEEGKRKAKAIIDLLFINNGELGELVADINQLITPQYHAALVSEMIDVVLEKAAADVVLLAKSLLHLVSNNVITADNIISGLKDTFEMAPDLFIDIPKLYDYLGKIVAPLIEKKYITLVQTFNLCESIIAANQGHLALKGIISNLNESMGPTFVKSKWQESELQLNQWMQEDQVAKWIEDNKFEFLEGGVNASEETKKILTPAETQSRLLQLMNTDENCECIKGWVQDKLGKAANEDWFMRALIQAICEHALYGTEGREVPHFNPDRMSKYASLINEFGESKEAREDSCLVGIQHLIHRLEHPQGLTLEIFQYLHEQYLISLDGFLAWEKSDKEPEGKGVVMMALTSFFTNIKEADNEDSCSED